MREPKRRSEEERRLLQEDVDNLLTPAKIARFKVELENLVKRERPEAAAEVRRTAEMGDLSENAGYQIAKAHLRRINNRILWIEARLANAVPIASGSSNGTVQVGSTVRVEIDGREFTFELVGSQETNPSRGRISHRSPIGLALLGARAGETVTVKLADREVVYRVIDVN